MLAAKGNRCSRMSKIPTNRRSTLRHKSIQTIFHFFEFAHDATERVGEDAAEMALFTRISYIIQCKQMTTTTAKTTTTNNQKVLDDGDDKDGDAAVMMMMLLLLLMMIVDAT